MPSIDPEHQAAVDKIAEIFGLKEGTPAWTSLSSASARKKDAELNELFDSLEHDKTDAKGTCGCKTIVFRLFSASYLPRFLDLYVAFAEDPETASPFIFILFKFVGEPCLGSYLGQRAEYEALIHHQMSLLLIFIATDLAPRTFASLHDLQVWWCQISDLWRVSLIFRKMLLHISAGRGVSNPITPSHRASSLASSLEHLIASLQHQLATPYDRAISARLSSTAKKEFSEVARRTRVAVEDATDQLEALVRILRLEDDVDARAPFKAFKSAEFPQRFFEDECALAVDEEMGDSSCKEGPLLTCARCKSVMYCSKEHQKLHWDSHKDFCFALCW